METLKPGQLVDKSIELASSISCSVRKTGQTVAVAESLTSGSIACHLGAAEESSKWFRGAVIAYDSEVKFTVLGVDRGPVMTASCAAQMVAGVVSLTGADVAVAVTGVGGPGSEEGQPSGTVFIAVQAAANTKVEKHQFPGDPTQVVQATTFHALTMLLTALQLHGTGTSSPLS